MRAIEIRDVCPRDGLQDYPEYVPTPEKSELVTRIYGAGIRSIEVSSFVSTKAVPQLADAAELLAALGAEDLRGACLSAFVATSHGAERALMSGVDELSTTVPATDAMSQSNFRRDRDAMRDEVARMRAAYPDTAMSVTIAVAFGCPFEGDVRVDDVSYLAEQLASSGYDRILLGDTIGVGAPAQVSELVGHIRELLPDVTLGAHFHDARGRGLANVSAALGSGATLIDTALAGMGGCPFAPGAPGNVATEDVLPLLVELGYEVDGEPAMAADAAEWARHTFGRSPAKASLRTRR